MGPIFKIISYTKHLWVWYVAMGIFVVSISLLSLAVPVLSKQIVDIIVAQIKGEAVGTSGFDRIIFFLVLILVTDFTITIMTSFGQWIGDILAVRLQTFLAARFYQHLLSLHIGFYDNEITGRIVNKMYRGITSITDFIQSMLNNFLPFLLTAVVTILLLAHYSFVIALLLAVLFPVYILISHGSTLAWGKYEDKKNTIADASQGRVFESIVGIRVVKAFAAQMLELKSFLTSRKQIERLNIAQTKEWHLYDFARRIILNVILFAIFAYIIYHTYKGVYSIGEMTLLLQLVQQARFPLFAMSFILGQIQQASAGSKDYFKLLETKAKVVDKLGAKKLLLTNSNKGIPLITFDRVDFSYGGKKYVLSNVNFNIYPGEKLALVGESGQGKSTIVNLLLRCYEPQRGAIMVSGQNIAAVTQNSLHSYIAVVFQESLLFSGTIEENIRYGKPKADLKEVTAAAKAANAHEFIRTLPNTYNSLIGERGVKLSGGQKQRIAIARAMLKDAPIIILDEATSSLDSKSELLVQQGLERLLKGRTSIIIAHRLSTIAHAHHILVIAKGTVAQYGTSQGLLRDKNGLYAQMVSLQQKLLRAPEQEKEEQLKKFDLVG